MAAFTAYITFLLYVWSLVESCICTLDLVLSTFKITELTTMVAFIWEVVALLAAYLMVEAVNSKMCYYVCKVTLREYRICRWFKAGSGYIAPQLCILYVSNELVYF
jgi:hypothetical protein